MNEHYEAADARMRERVGGDFASTRRHDLSFTLHDINRGLGDIIKEDHIVVSGWLEVPHYEAPELIYCPELAAALRGMKEFYPVLEYRHPWSDPELTGAALMRHIADAIEAAHAQFRALREEAEAKAMTAIRRYGARREPVRVNALTHNQIVINGIGYGITRTGHDSIPNRMEALSLYQALDIKWSDAAIIKIAQFIPDSPYVDIRIRKSWEHKGKPNWVNLETWEPVSLSDAKRAVGHDAVAQAA